MVFSSLPLLSIAVDYTHGILVERWRDNDRRARMAVASSVFFNLAILVFFKYWDFLAKSVNSLTGLGLPVLGLPLPIGISFYTFQTMSYTIDVYRRDAPVQRNLVSFGAYVTMFPQLIAGPIVQYKTVAAELARRVNTAEDFALGVRRFTLGLAKKVLLANSIGALWDAQLAARVFWPSAFRSTLTSPATPTWPSAWDGSSAFGSTRISTTPISPPR